MLDKIDLEKKVDKSEYKETILEINTKLGELQRKAKELQIPIILLFEGWSSSGKGILINKLILSMDPRGFKVWSTDKLSEEEKMHPFLWTYWNKLPSKGRISILNKSWYKELLHSIINNSSQNKIDSTYEDIYSFEKTLVENGYLIIKFFLHISKEEQKKRFKKIEESHSMAWKVTENDWKQNEDYHIYKKVFNNMLKKTDYDFSPWHIIEAEEKKYAVLKISDTLSKILEEKIHSVEKANENKLKDSFTSLKKEHEYPSLLNNYNLSLNIPKEDYTKQLHLYQKRLIDLQYMLYAKRIPVVIMYEGMDAAGKGGNIRRLTEHMDPRGYEVVPISAPNIVEQDYHYLWRFWTRMPKDGHISIFDRSWYGRVLVERIEGFCSEADWARAYGEINDMEKQLINHGTILLKFFLQIDKDEQYKRFKAREENPEKSWKITDEDWRNRSKWEEYEDAINEMLHKTSTEQAPWTVVESTDKKYARIKVLKKVVEALEKVLL